MITDSASLLTTLKLAHLSDSLAGESLESLMEQLQAGRPSLLSHLKAKGVSKLADRQTLTNGLSRAVREERIGAPGTAALAETTVPAKPVLAAAARRRVTRLYALSDLHWDFAENRKWLDKVSDGSHMDDAVVLAGDITHKMDQFEDCLRAFKRKFGVVIFVAGNHDLWIKPDVGGAFATSLDKLVWCHISCERLGVRTTPTRIEGADGAVWVVPLASWYTHTFDGHSTAESRDASRKGFVDFNSCVWPAHVDTDDLESLFAQMNTGVVEERSYDAPVITASHFLPRAELMPPRKSWGRKAYICDAVGSHQIEAQLRQLNAKMHIFGHTHISWDAYFDGVHYIQNAVRYPHERIGWKSRVDEIQSSGDLANILVWSSSDPTNFCPWPGRCGKCERSRPPDALVCPPSQVEPGAAADGVGKGSRFAHALPEVKGYFDDDETHEWASVPLPADWTRTYGAGTLTVCWRDQGWGSQKGCLWGRLVRRGGAALP